MSDEENRISVTNVDKPEISFNTGKIKKNQRIKPKFFKLLGQVMNSHMDDVLHFLDLSDLAKTRSVNKLFLTLVHEYYPKRLKMEVENIKNFQEINYDFFEEFMKVIDSQIPLSHKNWLDFDLNSVIKKIKILDKNVITGLRAIKSLGKLSEAIFAPFCIIFGYNKSSFSAIKTDGWKKVMGKIINDPEFYRKLQKLDLDNLNDADMLDAFVYLNLPEFELENVKKVSPILEKFILYCQSVVSYHILIHPFIYRNDKTPQMLPGSEMYNFITTMNLMLNRFYKFKRFLINLNIMNIPLAEYVFNLQHNREEKIQQESLMKSFNEDILGQILSFIPQSESHKLMIVNKKWKDGFKLSTNYLIQEILKEIFFLKIQASERLYKRVPLLLESNIFSLYFLMINDIINGESMFLSKEQLNDIKNIKIETETIKTIAKVACLILNEKPNRKANYSGEIQTLYVERLKTLAVNGQLNKLMCTINKLDLNETKIHQLQEDLYMFLSIEKLEEIKKTNRGIYQLLIWELFVYEFHKTYNPFDFISKDYLENRFESDELEIIKYFCEVMNYLKFNLKIKFKFNKGMFEFNSLFEELKLNLNNQKINTDIVFESSQEYSKVSKIYFETKELIPPAAKPAFFERIFNEILKITASINKKGLENINDANYGYSGLMVGSLGTIREENSMIEKLNIERNPISNTKEKFQLIHQFSKVGNKKSSVGYNDISHDIVIKHLLFFLDINSLPKFSMANKKSNECVKTHIFIRLHFLNKEKKTIEQESEQIIKSIENKREEFYHEYEIDPPKYEHATQLMQIITNHDVIELRQCFKKYNKNYEDIISPLVLLFGKKSQVTIKPDGTKVTSYFNPAQKLLNSNDFFKKLMNFELETIPYQRFKSVSKIIESPTFNLDRIKQLSPCLHSLIMWVMGVIEFHKVIRKYSLSTYDYDILEDEEIMFSTEMDNIMLLYYKLLRYANTFCKPYEKNSQQIMASMNIVQEKL